jgi:steroid delta-isomerase-like uncharacterized protein
LIEDADLLRRNKELVIRFNKEVIERGDVDAFRQLMSPSFINRTAAPGAPSGPEGMLQTFNAILRPALPDLVVEIHDQIAEGDKVTTRKTIRGTHRGEFLGIPPTGKQVAIDVIDIVRLKDGQYVEHWGINSLSAVLAQLRNA